ncbi:hypothetical protein [Sulfuriflexus mobilis]|uniref:hypothetical protein n=1 Tax=Sulfuriflexus mobilis TaxID=1811807 RepID=UPI000F835165|nr:hypothetical protein [Sulfuriflexus mobilis]
MRLLPLFILGLVVLVAGCGQDAEEKAMEEMIEKSTGGDTDVDITKNQVTIKGELEGSQYTLMGGEDVKLPKEFPDDIPIYPAAKVISSMQMPEGFSVVMTSGDDIDKVIATLEQEMTANGWTVTQTMSMGTHSTLLYVKKERSANVAIGTMGSETQISISVVN